MGPVLPAQAFALPSRLRATSTAAAAPNSRIIGGAGTGVPPDELLLPPLDEDELDEDEELLLDEDELEELLPDEPKLLEPVEAPELVELVDAPVLVEVDEVEVPEELDPPKLDELDEPPWLDEPWLEEP